MYAEMMQDYETFLENRDAGFHLVGDAPCPGCGHRSIRDDQYGALLCMDCVAIQAAENRRIAAFEADEPPI